jgi:hypothetical protein
MWRKDMFTSSASSCEIYMDGDVKWKDFSFTVDKNGPISSYELSSPVEM